MPGLHTVPGPNVTNLFRELEKNEVLSLLKKDVLFTNKITILRESLNFIEWKIEVIGKFVYKFYKNKNTTNIN